MSSDSSLQSPADDVTIRAAIPNDCEEILRLMKDLAAFEKMEGRVKIDADALRRDGFQENPFYSCFVAEVTGSVPRQLVGFVMYHPSYCDTVGRAMHLEDLYVSADFRGKKIGKKLWQRVAQVALEMGCKRIQATLFGWMSHARSVYERLGCVDVTETQDNHILRLEKDGMEKLAGERP